MEVVVSTCAMKSRSDLSDDHGESISRRETVLLQDMNSCYSKLKELVPTLTTHRKASRMEILQHVIDYIWDLQVELDSEETHGHQTQLHLTDTSSITVENNSLDDRMLCGY
ncbi:DNA-binding protein inhibitor ID-2-like [Myxocyprinus asiaticus]|uniref:DNA-binding protein inhibitor ID-2-like n=1 Tax=Myxocyprinus asiaticus TaxID=70543 RepID=UPI0022213C17|nr:DNA-binding protein inhibitor ID-2-like [Myxocyprinus asiaticus]